MIAEYRSKTNAFIGVGLAFQAGAYFANTPGNKLVGTALTLVGIAIFAWGCRCYMRGKGYHGGFGVIGLLSLPGLIVLALFPDRMKGDKQETSSNKKAA